MTIIEVQDLCYSYEDDAPALDHVSLRIKKGLSTAVLGGNGAGKSTLFLNLNGVLKPKSGTILIDGKELGYSKKELREVRQKIGIVFQDPDDQLFSSSVIKDISFGLMKQKLPEDEVRRRVDRVISQTGIGELAAKPTHALSFRPEEAGGHCGHSCYGAVCSNPRRADGGAGPAGRQRAAASFREY